MSHCTFKSGPTVWLDLKVTQDFNCISCGETNVNDTGTYPKLLQMGSRVRYNQYYFNIDPFLALPSGLHDDLKQTFYTGV